MISVEARQYPVTTHFSRRTELDNYLGEAHKKVCQIHRRLPAGGILVFLTGKSEIHYMCNKLRKSLNKQPKELPPDKLPDRAEILTGRAIERDNADVALGGDINDIEIDDNLSLPSEHSSVSDADTDDDSLGAEEIFREDKENDMNRISSTTHQQFHDVSPSTDAKHDSFRDQMLLEVLGEGGLPNEKPLAVVSDTKSVVDQTGEDQVILEPLGAGEVEHAPPLLRAIILPLYAMLPPSELAKIFALVPPDHRLIVVATNVAETSITIPGIRYVVDTGRQKQRTYDAATGVAKFDVVWISKASADQRQGRAGRTGPGHCYRLYSSAFYDQHMHKFRPPEITTSPIEDLVLQVKSLRVFTSSTVFMMM